MRAAIITPGDSAVRVETMSGDTLHWLQQQVGGWIEFVEVDCLHEPDQHLSIGFYINEEGKLDGLPMNPWATRLWFGLDVEDQPYPTPLPDVLCGPAVLTATDMRTGETVDLPDSVIASVRALGYPVAVTA